MPGRCCDSWIASSDRQRGDAKRHNAPVQPQHRLVKLACGSCQKVLHCNMKVGLGIREWGLGGGGWGGGVVGWGGGFWGEDSWGGEGLSSIPECRAPLYDVRLAACITIAHMCHEIMHAVDDWKCASVHISWEQSRFWHTHVQVQKETHASRRQAGCVSEVPV